MIHDVDESLRELVKRDVLTGSAVEIAFDAPTTEWATRRTLPTVDIYLYDIRENLELRDTGFENVVDDTGRVVGRRPPPRWFNLSYLVTAWTQRPEDEHRLLASLLGCFLRYEVLPAEIRQGDLAAVDADVQLKVALPPAEDRSISDVWSALGGELKPSLDLIVISPFDTQRAAEAGPPVFEAPRFTIGDEEVTARGSPGARRRGGRSSVPEEETVIEERVVAGGTVAGKGRRVRRSDGTEDEEPPGRIIVSRSLPRS